MKKPSCEVMVIGAGIIGISTAYFLKKLKPDLSVMLVDAGQAMAFTSAQSGENYRNWWPHPVMTAFTDYSIDLMEEIALETGNRINLNRRGYALVTRADNTDKLMNELAAGYAEAAGNSIRVHERPSSTTYQPPDRPEWQTAPSGVDVLQNPELIRRTFPSYEQSVRTVIHVRRAGSISGQQMGEHMLERFRAAGGKRVTGKVCSIKRSDGFQIRFVGPEPDVHADRLVNAAGPFLNEIAEMLGTRLPVKNTLQQKIAFEDTKSMIPRRMPFSIDLDSQYIDWDTEERDQLAADPDFAWLAGEMPGAIHCRPDGGDRGSWVKLGWAFNETESRPVTQPELSETFPEIVLRGAARLNPSLKAYYERLPGNRHLYGGYYTLTDENWPLIGRMDIDGAYVVGAMSGFGTMAACGGGELCARWVVGSELPEYASALSLQRYADTELMTTLFALSSRGIL